MHYLYVSALLAVLAVSTTITDKPLTIMSSSFVNNGSIPAKYSCEGQETSPPLEIKNIPAGTKSLALIVHDPDAGTKGFTHWVMWNIGTDGNIPEGFKGAVQGLNGAGKPGYKGMCPPTGTHHYHFIIYALDIKLNIPENTNKTALEQNLEGHVLAKGELIGLYKKTKS